MKPIPNMNRQRHFPVFFYLLFFLFSLSHSHAQPISLDRASFERATVSVAGPNRLYIRSLRYNGGEYSLLLETQDEKAISWKAVALYDEGENLAPENILLDYVQIFATGPDTISIRGIILDGESYSAEFQFTDGLSLRLTEPYHPAPMPDNFADSIGSVKGVLIELERERYEEKIETLETENRRYEARITGLQTKISEYQRQIEKLSSEKAECLQRIEDLTTAVQSGREQSEPLQDKIDEYEQTITELRKLKTEKERCEEQLAAQKDHYERRIENLTQVKSGNQETFRNLFLELQEESRRQEWEMAILRYENSRQEVVIRSLKEEKEKGEAAALPRTWRAEDGSVPAEKEIIFETPSIYTIKQDLNVVLFDTFRQAAPQIGTWKLTPRTAIQTDEDQYFAKLVVEIAQYSKPTLFSFQAKAGDEGWVGLGVHIFATNRVKKTGYGYGNSLLVWLTRDQEYYDSEDTRLQLYRSDNDVQMEMVLDAIIEEPISRYQSVDIYYEPVKEYITIFINSEEKLMYKTWFDIDSGLEIAFRSLGGGVHFKNPIVRTEE